MSESALLHSPVLGPSKKFVFMEDHDGAYHAWKEEGLTNQILLHFDAHIDFNWIAPSAQDLLEEAKLETIYSRVRNHTFWSTVRESQEERLHLGNYIHEAIQNGIVREFIWVYPDDPNVKKQSRAVGGILKSLALSFPAHIQILSQSQGSFKGLIYEKPFLALPYSQLGNLSFKEEVLLDIDLDFFVTNSLHSRYYPFTELKNPGFWLSPEDFCRDLDQKKISSQMITLAASVEEGYTPIRLKFLADELAERISGNLSSERERYYRYLCKSAIYSGVILSGAKDLNFNVGILRQNAPQDDAYEREQCQLILESLKHEFPHEAALFFECALQYLEENKIDLARLNYQKAIELDSSYRSTYNHPGPALAELGLSKEADESFAKMLELDATHPAYLLHKMKHLMDSRKWNDALTLAESIETEDIPEEEVLRETILVRAQCHFNLGDYENSWKVLSSYEGGYRSLDFNYFSLKAKTAEKIHEIDAAIEAYHELVRRWLADGSIYLSLARLYLAKGNLFKVRKHFLKSLQFIFVAPIFRFLNRVKTLS